MRRALLRSGFTVALMLCGVAHAQQTPIARGELSIPGATIEITKLERIANQKVVEMRFTIINSSSQPVSLAALGLERQTATNVGMFGSLAEISLLDLPNAMSYRVAGDSSYNLSSRWALPDGGRIPAGGRRGFWVWFGAPPENVTKIGVAVAGAAPLLDLALSSK